MSNIQIFVLFLIGTVLILTGAYLKHEAMPMDSLFLVVGMTFESVSILALVFKMLKKGNKSDSFLDS
ncbi:MAG TPA: hypothetical protein VK528_11100 [Flavobacterium sp.]|nr:hypothetical protein [Flavobacterium sp.]